METGIIAGMATELPVPRTFSVSVRAGPAGVRVRPIRSSPIWNQFSIEFEADWTVADVDVDEIQAIFHGDREGFPVCVHGTPVAKVSGGYSGTRPGRSGKWIGTLKIEPALPLEVQSLTVQIGTTVFVLDMKVEPLDEVPA